MNPLKLAVPATLCFAIRLAVAAPYDPSDDLMTAFGSQCSAAGGLADTARAQSAALKSVVASIYGDPECQGIIPMIDSLSADIQAQQQAQLSGSLNRDQLLSTVANLQSAIQVEQAKGAGADPDYLAALNLEIYNDRIFLLKAQVDVSTIQKVKPFAIMSSFYNHSKALLDGLAGSAACINKHPNILAQVGAQVLQLSSEWASGIFGSALLAGGGILDDFVKFIRNYQINSDLKKLMSARMDHALGCTLEGLASTFCRARDTQMVVDANFQLQEFDRCSTIAEGTNLLGRDLGAFTNFVQTSYAGSKASNPATASVKLGAIGLTSGLLSLGATLDGDIGKYEQNYNSTTDPSTKETTVRSLIRALVVDIGNSSRQSLYNSALASGPIGDAFAEDPDCGLTTYYYTGGQSRTCKRTADENSSNGCELCIKRVHPEAPFPSIADVRATTNKILEIGNAYVAQQNKLYKQNNPQLAITMSETYGQNMKKARQFLDDAYVYLGHLLDEPDGIAKGHMLKTIKLAKNRIETIMKILDYSVNDPISTAEEVALRLSDQLAPSSDTNYIPNEIATIVKNDIDTKLVKGKIDPNLALVLLGSTSESIAQFLGNYGSLESIRNQIRSAKALTKTNLETVADVFSDQIEDSLKRLSKELETDSDANDALNLFCMQLLIIPSAPKLQKGPDLSKYCTARMYYSRYEKKPQHLIFDHLARMSHEERACALYDFYRKADLKGKGIFSQH